MNGGFKNNCNGLLKLKFLLGIKTSTVKSQFKCKSKHKTIKINLNPHRIFMSDHIKARDGDFQSRKDHEVFGKFSRHLRMSLELTLNFYWKLFIA